MVEPGLIVLLGSGETQPSSGKIHEYVARRLPERPRIAILETPAGFEPNSALVAGKIARFLKRRFLRRRLHDYEPTVTVVPAPDRGTPDSPHSPEIVAPLLEADAIWLGPGSVGLGSPTHTVRQLRNSLALQMIAARQHRGAALFLSGAATLAFSTYAMPVYEIYKGGEELHWKLGLDFFGRYGLSLTAIPHWDNGDGGEDLDTSRCYIGWERFRQLHAMLPLNHPVLGIEEHTALIVDFAGGCCHIQGSGSVTLLRNGINHRFENGSTFPLGLLGSWHIPEGRAEIAQTVWDQVVQAEAERAEREKGLQAALEPPAKVTRLAEARAEARAAADWARADALRDEIAALGWQVMDTREGSELAPKAD